MDLMRYVAVGLMSVTLCAGCAAVSPAQVGQTAGTIAGAALVPGVGAPIGALVGLLAGMVVQGQVDKVNETHERKELSDQLASRSATAASTDAAPPAQGEPTRVWVDEAFEEGRLVAAHFDVRSLQP